MGRSRIPGDAALRPSALSAARGRTVAEEVRLVEDARRERNRKRWGPYLSERQWGTVREDYSPGGSAWESFPHDHARSRAYRWGEDGLLGMCDRQCRVALSLSLWNERDPILKERLFGLSGPEGNHGEDVKELYYDHLHADGEVVPLKLRSLVGVLPLVAVEVLDAGTIEGLPGFRARLQWYLDNRPDLANHISCTCMEQAGPKRLLAVPSRDRLVQALRHILDEDEFPSPYGIRSLSKRYAVEPYVFRACGEEHVLAYDPAESTSGLFGCNSNWRGLIWFPINYLLIEALERYHHFYGDELTVECPTGSGRLVTLAEVAEEPRSLRAGSRAPSPPGSRTPAARRPGGDRREARLRSRRQPSPGSRPGEGRRSATPAPRVPRRASCSMSSSSWWSPPGLCTPQTRAGAQGFGRRG